MQYASLISAIEAAIYTNNYELITGDGLQAILKSMVSALANAGATYKGVITPASALVSSEQACFFLATQAGTYTNYPDSNNDPVVVTEPSLVVYDGGASYVFSVVPLGAGGGGGAGLQIVNSDPSSTPYLDILLGGDDIALRIDMSAIYTGGNNANYIGSLIISLKTDGGGIVDGNEAYYYGHDLDDLLSAIEFYWDDDTQAGRLTLTANASNDGIVFTIYPMESSSFTPSLESATTGSVAETITPLELQDKEQVESAIGKRGVISQTQTWSGTGSNPRTYVMSNPVTGLIPQANIELFESAGATFNESTGYFELNGLTDISYEEMQAIYKFTIGGVSLPVTNRTNFLYQARCRTNIPVTPITWLDKSITRLASRCDLEVFAYNNLFAYELCTQTTVEIAANSYKLRKITGAAIRLGNNPGVNNNFNNAYSLEDVNVTNLAANISIAQSPNFSLASIVYMVQNAANTSAITITIHATAYARCQADTTEYTYGGNTYTGILALATAHNISIAQV